MRRRKTALKKCFASIVAAIVFCSCYIASIKDVVYADYNQGIVTFVTSLYSDCLGRTPDATGLDDWCSKLASGQISGKQAAYGFFFSSEFQTNANAMTDDELIDAYYKVFLNRAADPSGKSYWAGQIAGTTNDISILFTGFADSTEFADKCASYGITAGSHVDVPETTRGTGNSSSTTSGSIPIDAAHFPDPGFREFLNNVLYWEEGSPYINSGVYPMRELPGCHSIGEDGIVDSYEQSVYWQFELGNSQEMYYEITDLTGIEYFPNLCWVQGAVDIATLDISNNPLLVELVRGGYTRYGTDPYGNGGRTRWYIVDPTPENGGKLRLLEVGLNTTLIIDGEVINPPA